MRIMLVNSDIEESEKLKSNLIKHKAIERVDCFDNGDFAVETIIKEDYEIILFDLYIQGKDGIDILNVVKYMKYRRRPILLALIPTANKVFIRECIDLGVDYIFYKPYNLYSIYSKFKLIIENYEEAVYKDKNILVMSKQNTIEDILNTFSFKKNNLGYSYLVYGIFLCVEDNELLNNVTKGLYIEIANKFNTNLKNVERAIRHLIKSQYKINPALFFGLDAKNKQPSNAQFLAHIVKLASRNSYY